MALARALDRLLYAPALVALLAAASGFAATRFADAVAADAATGLALVLAAAGAGALIALFGDRPNAALALFAALGLASLEAATRVVSALWPALHAAPVSRTAAALILVGIALTLFGGARPLARFGSRTEIGLPAPPAAVWRVILPQPGRPYWKETQTIAVSPIADDVVIVRPAGVDSDLSDLATPIRVADVMPPERFTLVSGPDIPGADPATPRSWERIELFETANGGAIVRSSFVMERPTLVLILLHLLFDAPAEDLRRLRERFAAEAPAPDGRPA